MSLFIRPLLAVTALFFCSLAPLPAAADFNAVGKALTIMLGDSHFDGLRFENNLNKRILERYLHNLDPEKLYLTQEDVDEFTVQYTGQAQSPFDILLLRSRGMEPAREIYTRFATRVAERTEYIERLTDNAAFNFEGDTMVARSRKNAAWPQDSFAAQRIWGLKIADELLTEELLRDELLQQQEQAPKPAEGAAEEPPALPEPSPTKEEPEKPEATPADNGKRPEQSAATKTEAEKPSPDAIPAKVVNENPPGPLPAPPQAEEPAPKVVPAPEPRFQKDSPRKIIKKRYQRFQESVQAAADEEIADYFFSAVAQAHDPHSDYLSVAENERFDRELRNQLTGIGAELSSQPDGSTKVAGIIVNGPAHRQGQLQPNDRIVAIDPMNDGRVVDVTFLPIERVVQLILGRKDTFVGIIIHNRTAEDSEKRKVVIRRGTIELKNAAASAEVVKVAQPEGAPLSLGWITIPSFYLDFEDADPSVYRDVKKLVSRLKREGVDGIALDLRNNPGGSLTEVPLLAGLFLPRGPVVQAKDQTGRVDILSSTPLSPIYSGPLVVVTDRNSASSSEIFAGVLQDYNRAIIVGESSTFGKGTVQEKMGVANFLRFMQDPSRAGDLKATVQKFYRVTGSSTQLRGVVPDIVLPSVNDSLEIGERYLPHALPHDAIRPAPGFRPMDRKGLHLPEVAEKSRQRVQASQDFKYIREDIIQAEVEFRTNLVSLNPKKRLDNAKTEKERIAARNRERRSRFERMQQFDDQRYHFLRLALDDLERAQLETVDRDRDSQAIILREEENDEMGAEQAPEWPSGLDPYKREALDILTDLLNEIQAAEELEELKEAVRQGTAAGQL
ncbi:carboxy terminal-processing peptidase [Roseibacillus persicicus]|uniref:carboxy terminal-processing peptidase n=1 Tax=Roseibacillus persicicus TaxID=454148 RepID=UPI00398AA226